MKSLLREMTEKFQEIEKIKFSGYLAFSKQSLIVGINWGSRYDAIWTKILLLFNIYNFIKKYNFSNK